jgi:hypothetical protein
MAEKQKRIKGWSFNGESVPVGYDWDQCYETISIVDTVVKTGEGDQDFTIVKKVLVETQPIDEVVQVDASSVGIENIIKQVMRTGDTSLLPVDKGNPFVDVVGAPENLMELKAMGQAAEEKFNKLPEDLTKGMDMKAFVENLTQEQFDAFVKAMADKTAGKVEEKVNE